MDTKVSIPIKVRKIMELLLESGFEAYIVGGSVRDQLLGKNVSDFDITTSAKPDEIKLVFRGYKIMDYGEKHGTIGIYHKGDTFEITTFRVEGKYSDGRRPDFVEFVRDLKSDLARRDFTINAMAADMEGNVIDPFHGIQDLEDKLIRAVGNPRSRLEEDSLRILRSCRFALRLGFKIERHTFEAIKVSNHLINKHSISGERIGTEFKEIILHGKLAVEMLAELGILETLFPGMFPLELQVYLDDFAKIHHPNLELNIAALFYRYLQENSVKDQSYIFKKIFNRLKGYGSFIENYIQLIISSGVIPPTILEYQHDNEMLRFMERLTSSIQKKKQFNLPKIIDDAIELTILFGQSEVPEFIDDQMSRMYERSTVKMGLNGEDVKSLGFKGKQISAVLRQWQVMIQRDEELDDQDLTGFISKIRKSPVINIPKLRMQISNNHPKSTEEERTSIYEEIDRYFLILSEKKYLVLKYEDEEILKRALRKYPKVTVEVQDGKIIHENSIIPFSNNIDLLEFLDANNAKYLLVKSKMPFDIDFLFSI